MAYPEKGHKTLSQMDMDFTRKQKAITWIVNVVNDFQVVAPISSSSRDVLNSNG